MTTATADATDYEQVFGELAVIDPVAAEMLLDVATMRLEVERLYNQELDREEDRPMELRRLMIRRRIIKRAVRTLHEKLLIDERVSNLHAPVAQPGLMVEAVS